MLRQKNCAALRLILLSFMLTTSLSARGAVKSVQLLKASAGVQQTDAELRLRIKNSYLKSFGREPNQEEYSFWLSEIKAKGFEYKDLIGFQRQYLRDPSHDSERRLTILRAYKFALGRDYKTSEMNYWLGEMTRSGSNYTDIVNAAMNWVRGETAEQSDELTRMIRDAFAASGKPNASNDDVNQIKVRLNPAKLYNFGQMVEFVKKNSGKKTVQID